MVNRSASFRWPTGTGDPVNRGRIQGFTYIGILLSIALIGAALAAVGSTWSLQNRRMNEQQLLSTGHSFRMAIASYYNATPQGVHQYPHSLEQLANDYRASRTAHHLRKIHMDPITKQSDWELITIPDGSIIGVASRATEQPLKRRNFGPWDAAFENASCLCDWKFVYLPQLATENSVNN